MSSGWISKSRGIYPVNVWESIFIDNFQCLYIHRFLFVRRKCLHWQRIKPEKPKVPNVKPPFFVTFKKYITKQYNILVLSPPLTCFKDQGVAMAPIPHPPGFQSQYPGRKKLIQLCQRGVAWKIVKMLISLVQLAINRSEGPMMGSSLAIQVHRNRNVGHGEIQ